MPARLVTIPISHYCEKARWALDRAGSPTARSATCSSSTGSPRAGRAAAAPFPCWWRPRACSPSRRTSSPTPTARGARRAAVPGGARGRDEVVALERDFDADLGPEGRRWMYFHMLPRRDLGRRLQLHGCPRLGAAGVPAMLGAMSGYIRHLFAIGPETGAQAGAAVQRDVRRGRRAAGRRAPLPVRRRLHRRRPGLRRAGRARDRAARVRRRAPPARRAAARHGRRRARLPRPPGRGLRVAGSSARSADQEPSAAISVTTGAAGGLPASRRRDGRRPVGVERGDAGRQAAVGRRVGAA